MTTPDGLPAVLDPKFQVSFGLDATVSVRVPHDVGASSVLRMTGATLEVTDACVDSHNLTGDLSKAVRARDKCR